MRRGELELSSNSSGSVVSIRNNQPVATTAKQSRSVRELLVSRLEGTPAVLFALLFGSRASDRPARLDSDWDVGVFLDPTLTAKERFDLRLRLISAIEEIVSADVTVLNDAPPLLGHRALQCDLLFARDRVAYVR